MKNYSITTEIKKDDQVKLLKWLDLLSNEAFKAREYLESDWQKIEDALLQEFTNLPYSQGRNNSGDSPSLGQAVGEEVNQQDLQFLFYMPVIARQVDGWIAHLRRVGIPINKQFFSIRFDYHGKISTKYPFLVSVMEDAWKKFLNTSFHRIKAITKLIKGQKQSVVFGNTCLNLDYDKDFGLIDVKVVNIKDFALYPPKEDASKCCMVVNAQIPVSDITSRLDIEEKVLDDVIPETSIHSQSSSYHSQSLTNSPYYTNNELPYGMINAKLFFIPHYKTYNDKKEKFELKNALILIGESNTADTKNKELNWKLLKVLELDNKEQNPLLFCTFSPTLPNVTYDKGKLIQFLPHQALINLLTSCAAEGAQLNINPPLTIVDDHKGTTDTYQIAPGVMFPINKQGDISTLDIKVNLDTYLTMMNHIYSEVAKGSAITELLEGGSGGSNSSRKTATEATEERKSGEVRIDYIAEHQNDNYFQPFVFKYSILSQLYIKTEVEAAKIIWQKENNVTSSTQDPNADMWEYITGFNDEGIPVCPLFKNFLTYSEIEMMVKQAYDVENQTPQFDDLGNPIIPKEISYEELYQAIVHPLQSTNIVVEGSTSEITKREKREDFLNFYNFLLGLDTPAGPGMPSKLQTEGETLDLKEAIKIAKKLYDLPDVDLTKPLTPQEAQGAIPPQQPNLNELQTNPSSAEEARAQEIPQPVVEEPAIEDTQIDVNE